LTPDGLLNRDRNEIGKIIVPGVINKGDILKTKSLLDAELMGKSL